jgi:hypothetical protein
VDLRDPLRAATGERLLAAPAQLGETLFAIHDVLLWVGEARASLGVVPERVKPDARLEGPRIGGWRP